MPSETGRSKPILFRCKECGKTSADLGYLHGHAEKHRGFGPFNFFQWPWKMGDFDALMELTEVLEVEEYRVHDVSAEEIDEYAY